MKKIKVALINDREEWFWVDEWSEFSDGSLYLKRDTDSVVAVIAAGKWVWVADADALKSKDGMDAGS